MRGVVLLLLLALAPARAAADEEESKYFAIHVVDQATGRGVPLVELTTVGAVRYVTDSNGLVAFREPGLMGRKVFFHVKSHGYEFPKDGFGFRGKSLPAKPGETATLELRRVNVAERLYRITGAGIYRDTRLLGRKAPVKEPLLNGRVTGQDSALATVYGDRVFWIWGDTNRPAYPLGNFAASCATSRLPGDGGLDPAVGVDLTYFVDKKGFSRPMVKIEGPGPKWLTGLMKLADSEGRDHLVATYMRMKSLGETYERGLVVYNDEKERFERFVRFELDHPLWPDGHAVRVRAEGKEWYYFCKPFPRMRVRADLATVQRQDEYQGLARTKEGTAWRRGAGLPKRMHLKDVETGKSVLPHVGSIAWNPHRKRWIAIVQESMGKTVAGEIWFAEADTILGPWVYARKVVTHDRMSFYNPVHHAFFDQEGGRIIYFEGTYTHTFSGNKDRTPRYDYNQIMYRLDLDDPRLRLPVPVYALKPGGGRPLLATRSLVQRLGAWAHVRGVEFFAFERAAKDAVPIGTHEGAPLFYALRPEPGAPTKWVREEASLGSVFGAGGGHTKRRPDGLFWPSPAKSYPLEPGTAPAPAR